MRHSGDRERVLAAKVAKCWERTRSANDGPSLFLHPEVDGLKAV
jgi:hypothetical protein